MYIKADIQAVGAAKMGAGITAQAMKSATQNKGVRPFGKGHSWL